MPRSTRIAAQQASGSEDAGRGLLQGILPLDARRVPRDLLAGVTLAGLAIPEVLGYTRIAGMPVVTGLYTILAPLVLFAIFGSSRHLVVGADSATAAMLASGLAGAAPSASGDYVALAGLLALMAAAFLLLARIVRLGFLADFLSRTVLVGFLTGVGIHVALSQVPGLLGIAGGGRGPIGEIAHDLRQLGQVNGYVACLAVGVLLVIAAARCISPRIPGALLAVIGAGAASALLNLESHGVRIIGAVPGGLPAAGLPAVRWGWSLLQDLAPTAFAMFIVILAQSAATSRAYAARYGERVSENADLVGLAAANIGAALTGTFVVNGSPTKTQMVDSAGGRSQLAHLSAAALVLIVLLFLTGPLAYMPEVALSAVVFLIGVKLIDLAGMRRIYVERPWEFVVALITAAVVVLRGVEPGILLAIVLSLLVHTRHGYRPKNALLGTDAAGQWRVLPVDSAAQLEPGLVVYRFTHSMYYANAALLSQQLLQLAERAQPPLRWLCIDSTAVDDVDFSAAESLLHVAGLLASRGVRLVFAAVAVDVRAELDRSGITAMVGADAYFEAVGDVVAGFRAGAGPGAAPPPAIRA